MTFRIVLAMAMLLSCLSLQAPTARAQNAEYEIEDISKRPLMVIRFNQSRVSYEHPLYNTISRALEVKSSALFDVVGIAARSRNNGTQTHNDEVAAQNTQKILNTLNEIGLPKSRIRVSYSTDNVAASEVRIFVH